MTKKTILCLVKHYLPGFKYGGPIRSIANFVENFGDQYEIKIICLDKDSAETKPYKKIKINKWNKVGKAYVHYTSSKYFNFFGIKNLMKKTKYDLLYLNSFFTYQTSILPLLLRWATLIPKKPCILAPRGELSLSALNLKSLKKKLFIFVVKQLKLHADIFWQASNQDEKKNIININKNFAKKVFIASDLISRSSNKFDTLKRRKSHLKLVFLSRICPMKNLYFLLKAISKVVNPVELGIFGYKYKDDESYYKKCIKFIEQLPNNIKVSMNGYVKHGEVKKVLSKYDLFVLPTRGENFGHVIIESLSVGTPVLVSNKVFWKPDKEGGLQTLTLIEEYWTKAIVNWSNYKSKVLFSKRKAAFKYFLKYNNQEGPLEENKKLFYYACNNLKKNIGK
jgi:glycosyltransferase involved in cell wall biosynthesis